jgi:hypothetical protein
VDEAKSYVQCHRCESTIARFVSDGDQLVYETRGAGEDSLPSTALESEIPSGSSGHNQPSAYGRIAYTHAGGLDRPVAVKRLSTSTLTFFHHANWRGLYDGATTLSVVARLPSATWHLTLPNGDRRIQA